jgi:hypothetical protein
MLGRAIAGLTGAVVASAERSPPLRARAKKPSNTKNDLPGPNCRFARAASTSISRRYGENCWRNLVTET